MDLPSTQWTQTFSSLDDDVPPRIVGNDAAIDSTFRKRNSRYAERDFPTFLVPTLGMLSSHSLSDWYNHHPEMEAETVEMGAHPFGGDGKFISVGIHNID